MGRGRAKGLMFGGTSRAAREKERNKQNNGKRKTELM